MADHGIHADVVFLCKSVPDHLAAETDSNLKCIITGATEYAVVKTASATETTAMDVECETGAYEDVNFGNRHDRQMRQWLENTEGSGPKIP